MTLEQYRCLLALSVFAPGCSAACHTGAPMPCSVEVPFGYTIVDSIAAADGDPVDVLDVSLPQPGIVLVEVMVDPDPGPARLLIEVFDVDPYDYEDEPSSSGKLCFPFRDDVSPRAAVVHQGRRSATLVEVDSVRVFLRLTDLAPEAEHRPWLAHHVRFSLLQPDELPDL